MIKVIGSRGIGKTTRLIEYAKENNCIILSAHSNQIRRKLAYMGYDIDIAKDFTSENVKYCADHDIDFLIDDMDCALLKFFGENFKGYSLSVE